MISEYLEDGCTGTPLNVTTQHMTNPNVQAGGKGSEDGPNSGKSSSSSEDGPEGKEPGTDGQSGSKSSGDGSQDGPDGEAGGKGRRLLASTTPQPKGAKGCDGDDCTTPQPKGCDGDDCTTPQPKGCDGDDCTTPQPKGNDDDTANNGKGSSDDANNGKGSSSDDQGPDGPSGSRDSEDAPDGKGGSNSLESQCVEMYAMCLCVYKGCALCFADHVVFVTISDNPIYDYSGWLVFGYFLWFESHNKTDF